MDDGLLKSFGDEAIGVISASAYTADLQTPSNQRFVADSLRDYGGIPGSYAAGLYSNGWWRKRRWKRPAAAPTTRKP